MGRDESPLMCAQGINNTGSLGMSPAIEDISAMELDIKDAKLVKHLDKLKYGSILKCKKPF